jgi:hypothetical protein
LFSLAITLRIKPLMSSYYALSIQHEPINPEGDVVVKVHSGGFPYRPCGPNVVCSWPFDETQLDGGLGPDDGKYGEYVNTFKRTKVEHAIGFIR